MNFFKSPAIRKKKDFSNDYFLRNFNEILSKIEDETEHETAASLSGPQKVKKCIN